MHKNRWSRKTTCWARAYLTSFCVCATLLSLASAASMQQIPAGRTVGFQAHSYDDLREWVQLLKKGARYIKIDPNFTPQNICALQENVVNKADPRGCLLFTHDNAVAERTDYNTSMELLNMLFDPTYVPWFKMEQRIFIALCFKVRQPSTTFRHFVVAMLNVFIPHI